jgi:hypothetical protein
VATIHIDGGGSYYCAAMGKLLRSGIYKTDDPAVIAELDASGITWITVELTDTDLRRKLIGEVPAHEGAGITGGIGRGSAPVEVIRQTPPADPSAGTGALTTADLERATHQCPACDKSFQSPAGLGSHLRNRHPDYDITRGVPSSAGDPVDDPGVKTVAGEGREITDPEIHGAAVDAGVTIP